MINLATKSPRETGKLGMKVIAFFTGISCVLRLVEAVFTQRRSLCCLLILATCNIAKAQFPEYYVYAINGNATIAHKSEKAVNLKQHDLVYNQDIVVLKEKAELTLVDKDANFIILNTAGNYKIASLKVNTSKNPEGLSKKYLKLLWNELLAPGNDYTVFKKESLTELKGSPSRGKKHCQIFPLEEMKLSENTIHFSWRQTSDSGVYNFTIIDPAGKKLELPVRDTQYTWRTSEEIGQQPGRYCWLVKGDGSSAQKKQFGTCESRTPLCFKLITKEEETEIVSSLGLDSLSGGIIRQLEIVSKLEKATLIYRAKKVYFNLLQSNPEDTALLKGFAFFLLKYGFDEEALSAWNNFK